MRKLNNHKKIFKHDNNKPNAAVLDSLLTDLNAASNSWADNELKASNVKLYALLQDTYGVYKRFAGSKGWNSLLTDYLGSIGRDANGKMSFMGKVVRAVFDPNKHNITPWIGVLNIAAKQKVPADKLADWLTTNGGIDGVRRNITLTKTKDTANQFSREQLIDKAAVQCEAMPALGTITAPATQTVPDFAPEGHVHEHYVVALATSENGQLTVRHYTATKALVDEYLARLGKVVPELTVNTAAAAQPSLADIKQIFAGNVAA